MAPPWGADQGQGWGLQPGFQEATSSPAAARVLEQVLSLAPCNHRVVPPPLGYRTQLAEAKGAPEILHPGPCPHFSLLEQSATYKRKAVAVWGTCGKPGHPGSVTLLQIQAIRFSDGK